MWKEEWNPLAIDIDGNPAGLVWPRQTSVFSVERGSHEVLVRWARAHHIRSQVMTVEVQTNETVDLTTPVFPLVPFPRLRLATKEEAARAEANQGEWHFFGSDA